VAFESVSTPEAQRKSLFSGHKRTPKPIITVGPVSERGNGLREKTERRKVECLQVKSYGYGGLLSCAVFFSVPHPVTKGWDIFPFHSSPPSLAISLSLCHICTGESTAVQ